MSALTEAVAAVRANLDAHLTPTEVYQALATIEAEYTILEEELGEALELLDGLGVAFYTSTAYEAATRS